MALYMFFFFSFAHLPFVGHSVVKSLFTLRFESPPITLWSVSKRKGLMRNEWYTPDIQLGWDIGFVQLTRMAAKNLILARICKQAIR